MSPPHKWGKWGSRGLDNSPKAIRLVPYLPEAWVQNGISLTLLHLKSAQIVLPWETGGEGESHPKCQPTCPAGGPPMGGTSNRCYGTVGPTWTTQGRTGHRANAYFRSPTPQTNTPDAQDGPQSSNWEAAEKWVTAHLSWDLKTWSVLQNELEFCRYFLLFWASCQWGWLG